MNEQVFDLLIAGAGYLGRRVGRHLTESGRICAAITRSADKAEVLRSEGIAAVEANLAEANCEISLPPSHAVLWSVGFDSSGDDREAIWIDGLKRLLAGLNGSPRKFIYISSTSVYGPGDGSDLDETCPTAPASAGAKCCVRAETLLQNELAQHHPETRLVVLRLAGIYGPDRLLRRVSDLKAGRPLPGDPDSWLNLIHVDDAVRFIDWTLEEQEPPARVNVVNGNGVTRQEYYSTLATLVGTQPPEFSTDATSQRTRGGNKRIRSKYAELFRHAGFLFDDVLGRGLPDAVHRSENLSDQPAG